MCGVCGVCGVGGTRWLEGGGILGILNKYDVGPPNSFSFLSLSSSSLSVSESRTINASRLK